MEQHFTNYPFVLRLILSLYYSLSKSKNIIKAELEPLQNAQI